MNHTCLLLSMLLFCCNASAQSVVGSGAVTGRVWEESFSDSLPEADVKLDNDAVSIHRVMRTNIDGLFNMTGLVPVKGYKLRVTKKNFADWESVEFEILAGQTTAFDVTLSRLETARKVTAQKGLPVDKGRDGVSLTVTDHQIDMLPVPERRLESLILLSPAAQQYRASGEFGFPGQPASSAFLIDGLLAGNRFSAGEAGTANGIAIEAIQTFQVLSGGAPAEFGHTSGGIINAISRSGSSVLHGDVYGYFGSSGLNASDRYALGHNLFRKSDTPDRRQYLQVLAFEYDALLPGIDVDGADHVRAAT